MAIFNVVEVMDEIVNPTDVLSVRFATRIDEGALVTPGALVVGERDFYESAAPTDVTKNEVVLVAPADVYEMDNGMRVPVTDPTQIDYPANKPLRAYKMREGRRFKINTSAITGTPVAGQYVVPVNAGTGMAAAADLTGGTKVAFVVDETGATCNIFVGSKVIPATIIRVIKGI